MQTSFPAVEECNSISFTKLLSLHNVFKVIDTLPVLQISICISKQHTQVPCPRLWHRTWEQVLLSVQKAAASVKFRMGEKSQLQWKLKVLKIQFSNCSIFSLQQLWSPTEQYGSLTRSQVGFLSQGTTFTAVTGLQAHSVWSQINRCYK